jgi:hypothetical protein
MTDFLAVLVTTVPSVGRSTARPAAEIADFGPGRPLRSGDPFGCETTPVGPSRPGIAPALQWDGLPSPT